MLTAEQVALWADWLRDISATGLLFTQNMHDKNAFRAVQTIAMEMLASAAGESKEHIEPLRAPVFSRPTPFAVVDAAVMDDRARMLLIQRADNQKWAMPGGACEVGDTPAEGAVRETLEETGVRCRPISLVGVFDSRLCGTTSRHHLYQFVFLCELVDQDNVGKASHAIEIVDMDWFPEDCLPAGIDPGHITRIPVAFRAWHGESRAFFDKR